LAVRALVSTGSAPAFFAATDVAASAPSGAAAFLTADFVTADFAAVFFAAVFFAAVLFAAGAVVLTRVLVAATTLCAVSVSRVTRIPCWSSERRTTFILLGVISACSNAARSCSLSTEPRVVPIRTRS